MIKIFTSVLAALMLVVYSGISKEYTISVGVGYANDVFFSMLSGEVSTVSNKDWDLAFESFSIGGGILINGAKDMKLYYVPGSDGDSWEMDIDTTGMAENWERYYNSTDTWSVGAFNMDQYSYLVGSADYGWGEYNDATHYIIGSKLFVLILGDGTAKRIMIYQLANSTYTVWYADLDGSNKVEFDVNKKDFADKVFGYYSFETESTLDREPMSSEWDLLFGSYQYPIDMGTYIYPQGVTGARLNPDVAAIMLDDVDVASATAPADSLFSYNINTVGYTWKKYNSDTGDYDIIDRRVYFVMTADGAMYKLYFKAFGGTSDGNITFDVSEAVVSVIEADGNKSEFTVYPNVIGRNEPFNVIYNNGLNSPMNLRLYDINGNEVFSKTLNAGRGLNGEVINTPDLSQGVYLVVMESNGKVAQQKLIVE